MLCCDLVSPGIAGEEHGRLQVRCDLQMEVKFRRPWTSNKNSRPDPASERTSGVSWLVQMGHEMCRLICRTSLSASDRRTAREARPCVAVRHNSRDREFRWCWACHPTHAGTLHELIGARRNDRAEYIPSEHTTGFRLRVAVAVLHWRRLPAAYNTSDLPS